MIEKTLFVKAKVILLASLCIFLYGCVPYYKLSKSEFPQGKELEISKLGIVQQYLKSATIYKCFTTLAIFDALWLSDDVREAYVALHSQKSGKSQTSREALLNRQLEENKHWISFYVLADIRQEPNSGMSEKSPLWSTYIDLGCNKKIEPESIKEVELDTENIFFFGEKFNSFKTAYLVQFPACDSDGKSFLTDCTVVKLVISSVNKSSELVWNLKDIKDALTKFSKSKKKVKNDEDFYWG